MLQLSTNVGVLL